MHCLFRLSSSPRFAAPRLFALFLLLASLLSLAPAPGHAAAVAAASRPTPRNFTYSLTPQGTLTIAFDLANTGSASSTNTQLTTLSLVSLTNAPLGTRLTPAALPFVINDIAAGDSRHLAITYAGITAGTRARFSLAVSADGPVYASTGFAFTVPAAPVPTAAPTNLSGTRGSGGVTLTYTAPAGAVTSYNVKRSTVSGGPYITISTAGAVTGTTYTDTTAAVGTTYYYVVSAVSAGGESANSNQATVAAVLLGTGLVATPGNGSVTLTYDTTPGATRYLPYVSTDNATFTALSFTTATTYIQSGLTNGTTYYYYVVPYNGNTAGTASNTASALVSLPAPTNLVATPGTTSITLTFTASARVGAMDYEVFESTNPNAPASSYVSLGDTNGDTTFTQTGLTPGVTYYYYVVPQNAGGPGMPSATVHATVPALVSLSAPTSLTGTHGSGIIRLTWVAPTGAVSYYNVKRSTTSGGPYTTIGTAKPANGTTYDDTSVVNGTTYYYIVTAAATNGTESVPSNQAAVLAGFIGTGLVAAPGNGLVTLTYDAIIGATNYQVFYSGDGGANFYGLGYIGNVTTYTQTGLTNGQTYKYFVVPYNDAGAGTQSTTVSATVSLPAPTGITATPGNGLERIDWTASTFPGATNYQVFYSADGVNFYGLGYTGNVTTFTQTGLINGQTYKYFVVPYNDGGAGTPSVTISSTVSLPAPTNITLMPGNGLMKISWTASTFPGATNYQVFYSADNGANFYGLGFTGNATTFTQTGLTNAHTYIYYVVAYNDGGNSPNSLTATATVSLPAPTNVTATPGNGSVTVKWTASAFPGATDYQVFSSADGGANFYGQGYTGTATSYTQTGLTNGQTYKYYVVAYNDGGPSVNSATVSATVTLATPSNVVATPGNGLVTVTWSAVPTASNYQVFSSADGTNFYGQGYTGNVTTYTQTGLTNGQAYKYYVVAYNDGGPSPNSLTTTATVSLPAPTNVTATPGNGAVTVKWTASAFPGANNYQVFSSADGGANFYGQGFTGNVTTYTQTGLTNGIAYKYYVVPYNDGGAGTASAPVSATPTAPPA